MKVLLVEDEQSMLFTLTNILKHRGHEVIAAPSAEKGLEALGNEEVDLVISDLRLPGMDGISLITEVRERCEDVVPIIISAYGTLRNAIDALKLSVCDFLRKPFDLSAFEEAISRAEKRRHQLLANKQYLIALKENLMGEERKRTILSPFVSKHVVDHIMSGKGAPTWGGQPQRVSILFADISDFTGLSEKLDQKSLVFIVNTFYSELESIANKHGGIQDKFMGDGIMVVFSDSYGDQPASSRALSAAVQIQRHMIEIRQELRQLGLPDIGVHIGVSTGMATVCSIGAEERLSHTYIGDAVNVAKRLQNSAGAGQIYLSEAAARDLDGCIDSIPALIQLTRLPRLTVKGGQENLAVYRADYKTDPAEA